MTYPPRDDRLRHLIAQEINPHVASWKLAFFIADGIVTSREVRGELKRIAEAHAAAEPCGDRNCEHCWTASVREPDVEPADREGLALQLDMARGQLAGHQEMYATGVAVNAAIIKELQERCTETARSSRAATLREAADELDIHAALLADVSDDPAIFVVKARVHDAGVWREAAERLRRMADQAPADGPGRVADEMQQPTPCDQPNPCEDGELCGTHEEEQAHAEGEHAFCGVTCEVAMPSEPMRNFVIAKGYPGTKGALDELLRRAAAGQLPAAVAPRPETTENAALWDELHRRDTEADQPHAAVVLPAKEA